VRSTEKQVKVMRVDKTGSSAIRTEDVQELASMNAELVGVDCASEDEIIEAAKDADIIITAQAPFTRRVIEALPKCKVIIRNGVGYDVIDVDAATDNGIIVSNFPSPEWCVEEMSNHAIALLLACAKKLVLQNNAVKEKCWGKKNMPAVMPMEPIHGQTLGVIGCGNIGRMIARKAQCFKLSILGYDPYVDKSLAKESGITLVSLPELLKKSDFISISTLLNKETRHLIGERELKLMKPSVYIINTARGAVIDEPALIKALQEKRVAGAGLDVTEKEPINPDNPLLKMDNVIITPHSAPASNAVPKRARTVMIQELARILSGQWPKNVVNKTVKPKINLVKAD